MVDFIEEKKKQKRLVYLVIAVLLTTFLVIWFGFFRKLEVGLPKPPSAALEFEKVEIDFSLLENPLLKELEPFEGIERFEGQAGRENPFLSY